VKDKRIYRGDTEDETDKVYAAYSLVVDIAIMTGKISVAEGEELSSLKKRLGSLVCRLDNMIE